MSQLGVKPQFFRTPIWTLFPIFCCQWRAFLRKKTATLHSQPMGPLDQHKDEIDVEWPQPVDVSMRLHPLNLTWNPNIPNIATWHGHVWEEWDLPKPFLQDPYTSGGEDYQAKLGLSYPIQEFVSLSIEQFEGCQQEFGRQLYCLYMPLLWKTKSLELQVPQIDETSFAAWVEMSLFP